MGFSLVLAIAAVSAYSASLGYLNWWQRIGLGILTAIGFVGVFWLSRSTEPGYVLIFIYFYAWLIGGVILYSSLLLPLLGIVSIVAWKFKKPIIRIRTTWVLIAIACMFAVVGIFQRSFIKTTYYPLTTNHTELAGLRIAVLADPQFNIANNKQFARRITKHVAALSPDLILLPGDVFDGATLKWKYLEPEFKKWSQIAPTFMIPGNHEEYGDYAMFMDLMRRNGITTLEDQIISWKGISLVGFKYYGREKEELGTRVINELFSREQPTQPMIVLNHEPRYMELFASQSADLVLHGHTHGGQFWPMKYIVQRVYGDYWYGKNTIENTTFITSSGLGLAAFPSRLFNTPEVVIIEFQRESAKIAN